MDAEGLGQLFVRLTTKNFEEAVRARRDKRPPEFTDEQRRSARVHEGVGRHLEVGEQLLFVAGVEARTPHGVGHVAQPRVALERPDDERRVAHAQARVAPLLVVRGGPSPVLAEEEGEVGLRLVQVLGVEGRSTGSPPTPR